MYNLKLPFLAKLYTRPRTNPAMIRRAIVKSEIVHKNILNFFKESSLRKMRFPVLNFIIELPFF